MDITQLFAQIENCAEGDTGNACVTTLPVVSADGSTLTTVLGVVFATITAVSVIIIVVQGIKFVLSAGEPDKAAAARKGIIYAIVGLVLSLSANAIILFLLNDIF